MTEKLTTVDRPPEFLSADAFFQNLKTEEKELDIEGFGKILIKPITVKQRNDLMSASSDGSGKISDQAKFTAMTLHFGMVNPRIPLDRLEQIQIGNPRIVDKIARAIWEISGLGDFEKAKNA